MNGSRLDLEIASQDISLPPGVAGLPTLRLELDLVARVELEKASRIRFDDTNDSDRLGWREIAVQPREGINVFDSTAYGGAVTDEIRSYPEDSPEVLDERSAEFSFASGPLPAGATPLAGRDGRPAVQRRDRLSELISAPDLNAATALLGLLVAAFLGAIHALSPGHGKTVVGAYLAGSRGTARHAAFLGLTVTITHTAGVFALGLVTLLAAEYVLPEKLVPILSLVSGACVVAVGVGLLRKRVGLLWNHGHVHPHEHDHGSATQDSQHENPGHPHSHAHQHRHQHGKSHSHLPPGADGSPVTFRSLLALGISGGLVPCPSALVVLLSAISLHRVGYGLLLVAAFSAGLASVLTAVGLLFVYAGRLMSRPFAAGKAARVLPVISSAVITVIGAAICFEAVGPSGVDLGAAFSNAAAQLFPGVWVTGLSLLGFGIVLGLKHAVEADHLAAVATLAAEAKSTLVASLRGALWGAGHTLALLAAGIAVILFRVTISETTAAALEFAVAIMLIGLGANAIRKARAATSLHSHDHEHSGGRHSHPHRHSNDAASGKHASKLAPVLVGVVHGLAGSAALVLLVVASTRSTALGLVYILMFGIGSTAGMMAAGAMISLPLRFAPASLYRVTRWVRASSGVISIALGLIMAYEIGLSGLA
jgi:ABC-type nickel/cobalt efflux system permease component RcnA